MDAASGFGRFLIAIGFPLFIALAGSMLFLAVKAQAQYRAGLAPMNPLGCVAFATLLLVLFALAFESSATPSR